ncbi:MAG: GTP-binding protein [Promethearchaeota archaeon]
MDVKKLNNLIENYYNILGNDIISVVLADRDGLLLAAKTKKDTETDEEAIGGISSLVEPVLKKISKEFKSKGFGAATFDTEKHRLLFTEAGPDAVLVTIIDLFASIDDVFPYAYIAAEKAARIMDGRPVSPIIPILNLKSKIDISSKKEEFTPLEVQGKYITKIVMVGDGAVGKTSLVHTFVEGSFSTDYKATIGLQILQKETEVMNTKVKLMIWDLAGQGQFARVRKNYLQEAKGGLIVYDVTRPDTLKSVPNWYKEVKNGSSKDALFILIGNKIDLTEDRKVSREEGEKMAKELGIAYFETSAKDPNVTEEAFKLLSFQLISQKIKSKK